MLEPSWAMWQRWGPQRLPGGGVPDNFHGGGQRVRVERGGHVV